MDSEKMKRPSRTLPCDGRKGCHDAVRLPQEHRLRTGVCMVLPRHAESVTSARGERRHCTHCKAHVSLQPRIQSAKPKTQRGQVIGKLGRLRRQCRKLASSCIWMASWFLPAAHACSHGAIRKSLHVLTSSGVLSSSGACGWLRASFGTPLASPPFAANTDLIKGECRNG
jgi:hypothetical protein